MSPEVCRRWTFDADRRWVLEQFALCERKAGWARCRVLRTQPSNRDAAIILGRIAYPKHREPFSLGHEFVARVVEVGEPYSGLIGKRVICPPVVPCGRCASCRRSEQCRCETPFRLGREAGGAFCDVIDLPAQYLIPVPARVSDLAACCLQPAASIVANFVHARMRPGARVVILGQGIMGLMSLQVARAHGASSVVTTARREPVRRISEELGADACYAADDPDLSRLLDEVAADFIVDAAGGSAGAGLAGNSTASLALHIVRPYGTVLELSDLTEPIQLDPELRDKSIHFCFGQSSYYYGMYENALALLEDGRIRCDPIVTHEFRGLDRLTDAVEAKLERAACKAIQVQIVLDDPGTLAS